MKTFFALVFLLVSVAASASDFMDIDTFRSCKTAHADILLLGQSISQRKDQLNSQIRSHEMRITSLNTYRVRIQNPNLFYNSESQYQADLNAFNRAVDEINTNARRLNKESDSIDEAVRRYDSKIDDFENDCSDISVSTKDFNKVCGNSSSEFCRNFKEN